MLSPWKKRMRQFLGALQTAQTLGWILMQYSSPWETDNLTAEGNFRDQAHIFTLQRPQSETACLSLYTQACVRVETRNPSLLTQCSVLFQFFILGVHWRRITEQCHPKSFLFTICVLGRIYLEYVVQFITN